METITRREKYLAAIAETRAKGENLFGYNKGIWLQYGEGEFDEKIHGVQIARTGQENTARYRNLGFGGISGWYTASGEIYATSNMIGYFYICDVRSDDYEITTTPRKFVFQANVSHYYGEDGDVYNGFFDFRCAIPDGETVYIANLKIERGKIDNPIWTPAPEDVTVPPPITRAERYLHYICKGGYESKLPLPITREELYLNYLARMGVEGVIEGKNLASNLEKNWENGALYADAPIGSTYEEYGKLNDPYHLRYAIRCKKLIKVSSIVTISFAPGYQFGATYYDENLRYMGDYLILTPQSPLLLMPRAAYFAITIQRDKDIDIWPSDIKFVKLKIENGNVSDPVWTPAPEDLKFSIPSPLTIDERLWYGICGYGAEIKNASIGGENLLLHTNEGTNKWSVYYASPAKVTKEEEITDGIRGVKFTTTVGGGQWAYTLFDITDTIPKLSPYTQYTISFDLKSDVEGRISVAICIGSGDHALTNMAYAELHGDEKWYHEEYVLTTNDLKYSTHTIRFFLPANPNYVSIRNLKLELGEVTNTVWPPAPSDPGAIRIVTREQQLLWQIYSGITARRKAASASDSATASDEKIGGPEYEEEQEDVVEPQSEMEE